MKRKDTKVMSERQEKDLFKSSKANEGNVKKSCLFTALLLIAVLGMAFVVVNGCLEKVVR